MYALFFTFISSDNSAKLSKLIEIWQSYSQI